MPQDVLGVPGGVGEEDLPESVDVLPGEGEVELKGDVIVHF